MSGRFRASALAMPIVCLALAQSVRAQALRPEIAQYRWQEDWSFLADPDLATDPGDALKYIALSETDPKRYLSFGATVRERYERNDAPRLATTANGAQSYLLHRLELHADVHFSSDARLFLQLENALAPRLERPGPADANRADLRLAFFDGHLTVGDALVKWRIGRQEMAFDLQRFISVRDGPNVRQAYDALWADYERDDWRISGFASAPVRYRNRAAFDDFSNRHLTYSGARLERRNVGASDVSVTVSEYRNDHASFPAASGAEHRRNLDLHLAGAARGFDWDAEALRQAGSLHAVRVQAWGIGALVGYTIGNSPWKVRAGLQFDAASGDHDPADRRIGTFNPMFPNGSYQTLSGYTGYANFVHLKPSLTWLPDDGVKVLGAFGALWRQTTHDAIYAQPVVALLHTAGEPGHHTANYVELRIDWRVSRAVTMALETERYVVDDPVRRAGGRDSTYLGVEVRWGW